MKKSVLFIGIIMFFLISCKKEDTTPTTVNPIPESVSDYFPLKEGNYWVYHHTIYDSSGTNIINNVENDSIIVKNDTLINNKIYHKVIEFNYYGFSAPYEFYYRDSANFIVNNFGDIIFSINPGFVFKKIYIPDTSLYVNYFYVNQPINITLSSGSYNCVDFRGEVYYKTNNNYEFYLIHNYRSKNIGSIKKIQRSFPSNQVYQFELLRYKIN